MSRRPLLVLVAAACGLALTGCERPTPGVTLVSGTSRAHVEATSYCFDGPDKTCTQDLSADQLGVITVKEGEAVGIDVDKDLAESGWFLYDADSKSRSAVQEGHYFRFYPDFANRPKAGLINLEIRSTDRVAEEAKVTGLWRFQLVAG